ncbi:MAG: prephenate dehydrogenase/arogenate dehydrogenase family protein [Acidimicrobiia bacterium]
MQPGSAIVIGTGLLGASVGLALRSQGWEVAGWDPKRSALDEAMGRGAISSRRDRPEAGDADLVVLAAPPSAVVATLEQMSTDRLVTDIAGVKTPIVAAASHLPHFVGGHPMAGGESSGPGLASSTLFHGATWILTSDGAEAADLETMSAIVSSFGANPVVLTAGEHDEAVARVSHLPHLLAAALMGMAQSDPKALELAGGGFRDLTRIASADSGWWAEVLAANASHVEASIEDLQAALEAWRQTLSQGASLGERLEDARMARAGLGEHHTQVRVVLLDRPGEIARVGHALETSRVDVRDFQLRHGEHGGGGILTISVKGEGREALTMALVDEGFEVRVDD